MSNKRLELVYKNDNPKDVKRTDCVLNKDELIAIDRAQNIDSSKWVQVTEEDFNRLFNELSDEGKEIFNLTKRHMDIRYALFELVKGDLTFRPYIMLLDRMDLDKTWIDEMEEVLSSSNLDDKEKVLKILDIIDDYI